jgi:hypothetical protein
MMKVFGCLSLFSPSPANLSTFQLGDLAGRWGVLTTINGSVSQRAIFDHYGKQRHVQQAHLV